MGRERGLFVRPLVTLFGLIFLWWLFVRLFQLPGYLLPPPQRVADSLWADRELLAGATLTTLIETVLGLVIGTLLGALAALGMAFSPVLRRWLLPLLLLSQAVPIFALAPLLVLWFGFGIASKVVMAVLVIFFPVMSATFDGLRRVPQDWLDLAQCMNARGWRVLLLVRLPAALPSFGSGLRVAAALAPIGAVIGEWVGASSGLGYVMLNANARVRTDLMFAALLLLSAMTVSIWWAVDRMLGRVLSWAPR
ncbi:MAG TPA: ABC transporter permease [Acetobacteraceae bacterium]|nr:ABC transporter permease [Acetobacteraceae bacterium]